MADLVVGEIALEISDDRVATIRMCRPPANYLDAALLENLVATLTRAERGGARAVVLCSEGKHFCAGADFGAKPASDAAYAELYRHAAAVFGQPLPIVVAVQGRAIGGGLGLALAADFRVAAPATRFEANFSLLGLHHGFGLSVTLPAVVGQQRALDMLITGRPVSGEEASEIGLCDRLVPSDQLIGEAYRLASEIACAAPLAVRAIRATLRADLAIQVAEACARELPQQLALGLTADFLEGVRAARERRQPNFQGR